LKRIENLAQKVPGVRKTRLFDNFREIRVVVPPYVAAERANFGYYPNY
jgi:hypothetical protein